MLFYVRREVLWFEWRRETFARGLSQQVVLAGVPPDPDGAGEGGSSPDKAGAYPGLPDGAGPNNLNLRMFLALSSGA